MKTKKQFLFLLMFLLIIGYAEKASAQKKKDVELRVLSYNVHHCNPPSRKGYIDMKAIAEVIKNCNPDIVALQEIDVNTERSGKGLDQAKELGKLTNMYSFFVKTIDCEGGDYGIAILSKHPFTDTLAFALPMQLHIKGEPRGFAVATIEPAEGVKLAFLSTHLDLREPNRNMQIETINRYAQSLNMPIIIAGDFNATPDSYAIKRMDNVFRRSDPKGLFTIPVVKPNRTIDYIAFYPQSAFKTVKHDVINEPYASDHLPVFSILSLKAK